MEKEFDFLNDKALCVINDTEPCVIKYNGETIRKLSAIKSNVQGTTEVTYQSEYKQNLLNMSVEGNTEQKQYEGYNLAYCSTDNYFPRLVGVNILSKNSFTLTTKNSIDTEYLIFNIPVKPNTKVKISYNFTRNFNNSVRFIYWANSGLKANAGTYISQYGATTKTEGSVSQTITTGNTEYLGISFYIKETADIIQDAQILITDLMVTYDTEKTEFEPYVGGKPSPNVEYPQPIQNSSNVSVELEGKNLFTYKNIAKTQNAVVTEIEDGTRIKKGDSTITSIVYFKRFEIEENTPYYVSVDCAFQNSPDTSIRPNEMLIYYSNNTGLSTANDKLISIFKLGTHTELTTKKTIIASSTGYKYLKINFYVSVSASDVSQDVSEDYEAILKNIRVTKDDWQPYEPYFEPTTVQIPNEVTLADGTVVPLYMGEGDTLTIDKIANKVTYKSLFYQYTFTGNEDGWTNVTSSLNKEGKSRFSNKTVLKPYSKRGTEFKRYCTLSEVKQIGGQVIDSDFGVQLYFIGSDGKTNSKSVYFTLPTMTTTEFKQWLKDNPTTLRYEVETPIEYDLTDTDLGQQLLTLANNTQNATNIINISADVPVSNLNVDYAVWGGRDI